MLLFLPKRMAINLNLLFAALALGIILTGWQALILAETGRFSLLALSAAWFAIVLILTLLTRHHLRRWSETHEAGTVDGKHGAWLPVVNRGRWLEALFLFAWVITATWLYFRPHEAIMGGADAGVYVSLGAEIAQNGGFQIVDETLANLDPALWQITLRPLPTNPVASSYLVPGFYVTDAESGTIAPQFYPLHPVWQAAAFALSGSTVDGINSELMMTGLWMLLASLAVYLTARELAGRLTAALALLGLSLMALQVWFARYPTTEALTQFLLWTGLWAVLRWLGERRPSSLWPFLAGSALGSVFLVRIDILIMLPLVGLLVVALWARGWRRGDFWFLLPFSVLVAHSFLHAIIFSAPYFYEHIGFGLLLLWQNWLIPVGVLLFGIIFLAVVYFFRGRFSALRRYRRPLLSAFIGLILLFALYGWFIRPTSAEAVLRPDSYSETLLLITNHENWLRLGWYLSPLGIWLGVSGACLLLWRVEWRTALLLAVGFLFTAVYLWNVRANPHQIYVMRRYVPVVAPFFILAASYLLGDLFRRVRSLQNGFSWPAAVFLTAGLLLSAAWLFGLGWSARGFLSQVDHHGVVNQLAALNQELPSNAVLLFNDQSPVGRGDFWGTPLKFIYGHDVFTLRDLQDLDQDRLADSINSWQNNGRSVVWIGDPAWLVENGFQFQKQIREIQSSRLESSYEHKPQAIVPVKWALPLAFIEPQ